MGTFRLFRHFIGKLMRHYRGSGTRRSRSLLIPEINRTGMNALKDAQHFRARTRGDQQTAGLTVRFNQLRMTPIHL